MIFSVHLGLASPLNIRTFRVLGTGKEAVMSALRVATLGNLDLFHHSWDGRFSSPFETNASGRLAYIKFKLTPVEPPSGIRLSECLVFYKDGRSLGSYIDETRPTGIEFDSGEEDYPRVYIQERESNFPPQIRAIALQLVREIDAFSVSVQVVGNEYTFSVYHPAVEIRDGFASLTIALARKMTSWVKGYNRRQSR